METKVAIPTIEDLYKSYEILSEQSSTEDQKSEAFTLILNGVKGGEKEKRLASQFITRFFRNFPDQYETTFLSLLDLCDDDEVTIRKQAVHDLPCVCKAVPSFIPRVADILVQMLQTDDGPELHGVQLSLTQLMELDAKSTLSGIFHQILNETAESIREKAIKLLSDKLKLIPESQMKPDLEELVIDMTKKALADVSEEEFHQFITILSSLKSMSTVIGRQKLVDMITEQASQAAAKFLPEDPSYVARILESSKQAIQFLSKNVHAGILLGNLLDHVFPRLNEIPDESIDEGESPRLSMLRVLAQLSSHPGPTLNNSTARLTTIYNILLEYMPKLPEAVEELVSVEAVNVDQKESVDGKDEKNGNGEISPEHSNLKFSELECLLYTFHQLGRHEPDYLTNHSEEAKLLRKHFQYLSQATLKYTRSLQDELTKAPVKGSDLRCSGEDKIRLLAYKVTNNIQTLIRELFKTPTSFKAVITPSWYVPENAVTGDKRRLNSLSNSADTQQVGPRDPKTARPNQTPYQPPARKFSTRAGNPPQEQRWRGGGGGGRGNRRGGGNRGNWGRRW